MLLLAYLLTRNPEWRDVRVQVMSAASNDLMKAQTEKDLNEIIAINTMRESLQELEISFENTSLPHPAMMTSQVAGAYPTHL